MRERANGVDLEYSTLGTGTPCLWVTPGGFAYEQTVPAVLSRDRRFHFVKMRGCAGSGGHARDITTDIVSDDLDALREVLGYDQVEVWGHSMFGMFAIEHARRHPETTSGAVAVATPPVGDLSRLERAELFWQQDASATRKRIDSENQAALAPEVVASQYTNEDSLWATYVARGPRMWFDPTYDASTMFGERMGSMRPFLRTVEICSTWSVTTGAELTVPLFVGLGRHDYGGPHTEWDGVRAHLRTATVELFGRSGHFPYFEEADEFAARLDAWSRQA